MPGGMGGVSLPLLSSKPGVQEALPHGKGPGGCAPSEEQITGVEGALPPPGGCPFCFFLFFPPPFAVAEPGFRVPPEDGLQEMPPRPQFWCCGGTPPTSPRQGDSVPLQPGHEGKTGGRSPHPGGLRGGPGGKAPWQGVWGMCPQKNQLKGREGNSCNPAPRGTLNPGKPQANEGGEKEKVGTPPLPPVRGRSPPPPPA